MRKKSCNECCIFRFFFFTHSHSDIFCLIKCSYNWGTTDLCISMLYLHLNRCVKRQRFILNIVMKSQTIFLHDLKRKSYFTSYFLNWCTSIFTDLHLLCLEAWIIFWWHWLVLYAGYSMHLLVIKYIAWIQSLCICTYFIIALLSKCKENQKASCTVR